jgi:hypothetical protein
MYNLVFSGFATKEQAEEFLSWYDNSGEQDFGTHLDCQECPESFMPVNYSKIPEWFGDNYVAHLQVFMKDKSND